MVDFRALAVPTCLAICSKKCLKRHRCWPPSGARLYSAHRGARLGDRPRVPVQACGRPHTIRIMRKLPIYTVPANFRTRLNTVSQIVYNHGVTTDDREPNSGMGLKEAARRLRERLAVAEEAEAHARERAEALRIALREVEMLIVPTDGTDAPPGREVRDLARVPPTESGVRPQVALWEPLGLTTAGVIRDILTKDPRPWNATEVIAAVERYEGIDLRNPSMAVRAALRRMVARGEVERVGRGFYQAVTPSPRSAGSRKADMADSPFGGLFLGMTADTTTTDPKEDT